jgi:hypothetical protein
MSTQPTMMTLPMTTNCTVPMPEAVFSARRSMKLSP